MLQVTVRFFGPAADLAELPERNYALETETSLGALAGTIASDYPRLASAMGVRLAVNHRYVPLNHILADGDEVAVIPPVSGG